MESLKDVLQRDFDIRLDGWKLTAATDISPDGLNIVGCGVNPAGQEEGWLVRMSLTGND